MPALLLCLLLILAGPARAQTGPLTDPARSCVQAVTLVEREHDLPAGLLLAIARVESGRPDPATGAVLPWPWTINAEGEGAGSPLARKR